MLKKFDITPVVFTLLLIVLGIICYKLYSSKRELEYIKQQEINFLDEKLKRNESIIDSLENNISLRESLIDSLSFSYQNIIEEKKNITIDVKELPLTDAVQFLKENLKIYEEKTDPILLFDNSSNVSLPTK